MLRITPRQSVSHCLRRIDSLPNGVQIQISAAHDYLRLIFICNRAGSLKFRPTDKPETVSFVLIFTQLSRNTFLYRLRIHTTLNGNFSVLRNRPRVKNHAAKNRFIT